MTGGNNEPQPPRWAVWVARAIAVVIVVPAKLIWEALKAAGRLVSRPLLAVLDRLGALARFGWHRLLVPVGRGLGHVLDGLGAGLEAVGRFLARFLFRPLGAFLRALAGPLERGLEAVDRVLLWMFDRLARPAGRGLRRLARGVRQVFVAVVIRPLAWCWRTLVLVPLRWIGIALRHIGYALVWLLRWLLVPLRWLCRRVLRPVLRLCGRVLRLFGDALVWAHRRVAAPLWRLLVRVFRWVFVNPLKWVYRAVLAPVGRAVRQVVRQVVDPVRLAGRRVRAAFGRRT